jgi:glycosyltransferase involved in cell wall biosynthesis
LFTPEIRKDLFENYQEFDVVSPDNPASKIFKSLWRSFSISNQLKHHGVEIFHGLSNELPSGIEKTSIPSVVTIHDLIFMRFPQFYSPIDRNIYLRKSNYACKVASKIIAISHQTKNEIIKYLKINPEKIEVIYQSISPLFYERKDNSNPKKKYNLPDRYILSVGTIENRKNQLSILKAIYERKLEISVVFVGNHTSYTEDLMKYIAENNLENQVKFLSNIPQEDLVAIYQNALVSVYISVFEGFGLPVIEAMASGCPVITSNVSVLPETASGAAMLCDPQNYNLLGEKINTLLVDETERQKYIEKGLQRAVEFHPDRFAQNMMELYQKILL